MSSEAQASLSDLDPHLRRRPRLQWALVALLMIVGVIPRLWDLDGQSLWVDEIIQTTTARLPLAEIPTAVAINKPPLDYIILHFVLMLGEETETLIRTPAAVWSCLLPLFLFLWARSAFGPTIALSALALAVSSPLLIRFSHNARPYSLWLLMTVLSNWALWEIVKSEGRRSRWWVIHFMATLVAAWTLYFTLLITLLQQIWAWGWWARQRSRRSSLLPLGSLAISLLCFASVFIAMMIWIPARNPAAHTLLDNHGHLFTPNPLESIIQILSSFTFGSAPSTSHAGVLLAGIPLLVIGITWGVRRKAAAMAFALIHPIGWVIIIATMMAAIDHWLPVRYVLGGLPTYLMILAAGIAVTIQHILRYLSTRRRTRVMAWTLAIALSAWVIFAVQHTIRHPHRHHDWRGAAAFLAENINDGDTLLIAGQETHRWLRYYLDDYDLEINLENSLDPNMIHRRSQELRQGLIFFSANDFGAGIFLMDMLRGNENLCVEATPFVIYRIDDSLQWRNDPSLPRMANAFRDLNHRIDIGREICNGLGAGWHEAESFNSEHAFRWTGDTRTVFNLPSVEHQDWVVAFRIMPFEWPGFPPQSATIEINGTEIASGAVTPGWHVYGARTSAEVWRDGVNEFTFEIDHVFHPEEYDDPGTRNLGIGVDWIQLFPGNQIPVLVEHEWTRARGELTIPSEERSSAP